MCLLVSFPNLWSGIYIRYFIVSLMSIFFSITLTFTTTINSSSYFSLHSNSPLPHASSFSFHVWWQHCIIHFEMNLLPRYHQTQKPMYPFIHFLLPSLLEKFPNSYFLSKSYPSNLNSEVLPKLVHIRITWELFINIVSWMISPEILHVSSVIPFAILMWHTNTHTEAYTHKHTYPCTLTSRYLYLYKHSHVHIHKYTCSLPHTHIVHNIFLPTHTIWAESYPPKNIYVEVLTLST